MRRYSAPAVADIPDTASLTDVVFTRAGTEPGSVMLRRLTDSGQWQDVTTSVFRDEVTTLARGIRCYVAAVEEYPRHAVRLTGPTVGHLPSCLRATQSCR